MKTKTKTKTKPSEPKPDPVLACLIAARKRITPEGAWCQGGIAKDETGVKVDIDSPRAVAWCAWGATGLGDATRQADAALARALGSDRCVVSWNDDPKRTKKQVLALFDKAIALRRKEVTK